MPSLRTISAATVLFLATSVSANPVHSDSQSLQKRSTPITTIAYTKQNACQVSFYGTCDSKTGNYDHDSYFKLADGPCLNIGKTSYKLADGSTLAWDPANNNGGTLGLYNIPNCGDITAWFAYKPDSKTGFNNVNGIDADENGKSVTGQQAPKPKSN